MDCPCIVCGERILVLVRITEAGRKALAAGFTERELPAVKGEGRDDGLENTRL